MTLTKTSYRPSSYLLLLAASLANKSKGHLLSSVYTGAATLWKFVYDKHCFYNLFSLPSSWFVIITIMLQPIRAHRPTNLCAPLELSAMLLFWRRITKPFACSCYLICVSRCSFYLDLLRAQRIMGLWITRDEELVPISYQHAYIGDRFLVI